MAAAPYTRRIPKLFRKTITFDGTTGNGDVGTVAVATVTGAVQIVGGSARCTTDLVSGGGGTIKLGVAANTDGLIPQTTATDIDAGEFWQDATPEAGISPAIVAQNVKGNIILTIATGAITAGVLEIVFYWLPLSTDGNMA